MITCHGCSLTKYKWKCWPEFLQWFVDDDIHNYGVSGNANETITRSVIDTALRIRPTKMYIMWTGPDRYEIIRDEVEEYEVKKTKQTFKTYNKEFGWNTWAGGHWNATYDRLYKTEFSESRQNQTRNLERVLYIQHFLQKLNVDYVMMQMNAFSIQHHSFSKGYSRLYDQVDWDKWVWYEDKKGLLEFQLEQYPDQIHKGDWHPAPYAHYEWLRQIVLKTDQDCPPDIKKKIIKEKR